MPRIIHFEIPADDPDKVAKFYTETFGWEIKKWDGPMDYWLVMTGDRTKPGIDGGLYRKSEDSKEVINIVDVADIKEFVEKVKQNGGMIDKDVQEVPGVGLLAYAKDPDGNKFGMMQPFPDAKMG